ncbi:MAG: hypothetical protein ACOH5I_07080 [Oligoflexus sp.]
MKFPPLLTNIKHLHIIQHVTALMRSPVFEKLYFPIIGILYICYALISERQNLFGDEWRYLYYADNLIQGYYSPSDRVFLWNGPLYPLFLVPFQILEIPKSYALAANGIFYAFALKLLYKILLERCQIGHARLAIFFLTIYLPIIVHFKLLYTETMSFFLVSAWIYCFLQACRKQSFYWWCMASICFALIALCKVLYGHVILSLILIACVALWISKAKKLWSRTLLHGLFALFLCSPYLIYTYKLTGKIFYWGSPGSSALYWMSSPYPEETGEWFHQGHVYGNPVLRDHHRSLYDRVTGLDQNPDLSTMEQVFNLSTPESSDIFSSEAIKHIKMHPLKYFKNWLANLGRLWVDWPYSFKNTLSTSNRYLVFNSVLIFLVGMVVLRKMRGMLHFTPETKVLWATFALAFFGSSLVSGMGRLMIPNIPLLIVASLYSLNTKTR